MRKFKVEINESIFGGFEACIYVKGWIRWHLVTKVEDDDIDYVENRAAEIVDILENPNR